jgi:Domain of unknown function (DU1801)
VPEEGVLAANKTQETSADVAAFVANVADPAQRADADALIAMMSKASGNPPRIWGPSIIGFGQYHYRYDSGREGDMCRIGFSPRKGQTVIYIVDGFPGHADLMTRLGKHKTGKSCLYIKRLSEVDMGVLGELVDASLTEMDRRYPPQ